MKLEHGDKISLTCPCCGHQLRYMYPDYYRSKHSILCMNCVGYFEISNDEYNDMLKKMDKTD